MIVSLIIAVVAVCLFPYVFRLALGLFGIAMMFVLVSVARAETQTTCYQQGTVQVCETRDRSNALISTSRCYQAGNETRCDSSSSSSSSSATTIIVTPRRNP